MKILPIASILALTAGLVQASPFAFEKQFASPDLDPSFGRAQFAGPPARSSDLVPSVRHWYRGNPDVDVSAGNRYQGNIVPSGPSRISLYEIYRGNPEGIGYRDYHERYPTNTDWAEVAREHHRRLQADEVAKAPLPGEVGS